MHLQEGIGRDGYRMLAIVFALIAALGLGTTVYAFQPGVGLFNWLGLGLTIVGASMLLALNLITLNHRLVGLVPAAASQATPAPAARPRAIPPTPAPSLMPAGGYEFPDSAPAAMAAPESLVMPKAFAGETTGPETAVDLDDAISEKDPKDWPRRKGKAGITRRELAEKYTRKAPAVREILLQEANSTTMTLAEVPIAVAKTAGPQDEHTPDGMTRGKCGGCSTVLLAPSERPMKLRCPQCDKVTLLK